MHIAAQKLGRPMYESYYISIRRDPLTTTVNISLFSGIALSAVLKQFN